MHRQLKSKNYFNNKVVVITGGAGGLASALITPLMASGATIVALDLNIDKLTNSANLLAIAVDITDDDALKEAITRVISRFGRIDILINNAGITHISCFSDLSAELFNTIMAVNFTASVNITRLCLPYLVKTQGQIIAISSVAGFAPLYGRSAYSASKHAMEGFFRSLAAEIIDDGIAVTVVCPAFVKSRPELSAQANNGITSPGALKKHTNGEQISPEQAAKAILNAIIKRQPSLYLGKVAHIARWLFALTPNFYSKIMTKGAKQEFN